MINVKRTLPAYVAFEGGRLPINVKRMQLDEFLAYESQFNTYQKPMAGEVTPELVEARAREMLAWLEDTFARFVTVPAGELQLEGEDITSGQAFYDLVGPQLDTKIEIATQVWIQNRLPEEARKNLQSLSGSATTSDAPPPGAAGPTPERTAASADPLASATTADAGHPGLPVGPSGEIGT